MKLSLKQKLRDGANFVVPGAGDALGAILIEKAGFDCISMSGYQVCATLGMPDAGLATLNEMVMQAARMSNVVSIPIIADADNGHGNVLNVARTVRDFEQAGVAAIHLEDQSLPKKCGHMAGHVLVSAAEMCGKIEVAIETRQSQEFLIIARSDAIGVGGLSDAIYRGQEYRKAGADAVMVMKPQSVDDLKRYRDEVDGPLVISMGSWDVSLTAPDLHSLGYQLVLFPLMTLRRAISAASRVLAELKANGFVDHDTPDMVPMHELHELFGQERIKKLEERFLRSEVA